MVNLLYGYNLGDSDFSYRCRGAQLMGSLILFVLGVAAPLAAALAVMWLEERRRAHVRMHFDRVSQDNRGLKLALSTKDAKAAGNAAAAVSVPADVDPKEVNRLVTQLAEAGILMEWLRLGLKSPAEVSAHLLGVSEQEAEMLHQATSEWGAHGVAAALDRLKGRLAAVAEMEMIWADPHSHGDRDASAMLERTMWVFEPEYVVGEGRFAVDPQIGAVSKPAVGASLAPGQNKDGEPTLVVELKNARVTIGAEQQLQAWNNVRELIRGGHVRERDPVEVFVVGGGVDELEANPRVEGRYRNVRITSYDYTHLIARAKRLTFGLYDELKDVSPFLRQHREAIATAEQHAADQAATEASGVSVEDDIVRPADEADTVRHAEYAEASQPHGGTEPEPPPQTRRTGFGGDHIVIGQRKQQAAQ